MGDILKAYQWAIDTCNADNVGYSQAYRNQQTVGGITYYDCSSFINYALLAGDFETPSYAPNNNAITTYTEEAELLRLGFVEVDATAEYKAGDIGLSSTHTEMCYQGGQGKGIFMGAHTSNASLENQVSIGSSSGDATYQRSFPKLFRYGSGAGVSSYVVASICGCWARESLVNPGVWESLIPCAWDYQYEYTSKGGYGLGQWTNVDSSQGRLYKLHTWVTENGYADGDGTGQVKYMIEEEYWTNSSQTRGDYTSLSEFLASDSTSLDDLVWDFLANWEGVPGNAYQQRLEYANSFLAYINAHSGDDPSSYTWVSSNSYLSEADTYNNVMCIYFLLSGYIPPTPVPSHRSKLPLYMMLRRL